MTPPFTTSRRWPVPGAHQGRSDADAALDEYQRRRYRFVRAREVLAHAMYEVFRDAGPGALSLRAGMFRYWRATSALARTRCGSSPATTRA